MIAEWAIPYVLIIATALWIGLALLPKRKDDSDV